LTYKNSIGTEFYKGGVAMRLVFGLNARKKEVVGCVKGNVYRMYKIVRYQIMQVRLELSRYKDATNVV